MAVVPPPAPPGASAGAPPAEPLAARAGLGAVALVCLAVTLLFTAATVALFRRAYPLVDVDLALDRAGAIRQARALAAADRLAPATARAAATFARDDSLATYVDLAAGGADSVRALARRGPVPLYAWSVRLYTPGSADEVTVRFTPDGRPAGVDRDLPEAERRPDVDEAAGHRAAELALARYAPGAGGAAGTWRLVASSYETRPRSGRVDRTYRFERLTAAGARLRVGAAPVRADVAVTGDSVRPGTPAVLGVHVYADVPEAWARRHAEMRSANDFLALLSTPPDLAFAVAAVAALVWGHQRRLVRWGPAAAVGGTVGALVTAAGANDIPLAWATYNTATSPATFVASNVLGAVAGGAAAGLWVTISVAAAELLTRRAFPDHYDWYAYPRHAGAAPVAGRLLGGYALAAFGFLYVSLFYLGARSALGWWVPTESLDDPNAIATPLPWVAAIGTSLLAGTWEEAVLRAVPLALLSLWARDRPARRWWMAAGVVVTALAFGFGHADYPSWPAYSRGVELFAEAALWAVLYLRVGLPTTIVAHALYDLAWFGLFALHGRGAAYRGSAAAVLLAAALPALVVAAGWWRARAAPARGADPARVPRLGDWAPAGAPAESGARGAAGAAAPARGDAGLRAATARPARPAGRAAGDDAVRAAAPVARLAAAPAASAVSPRLRLAAGAVVALGLAAAAAGPRPERAGPGFTAPRAAVARAADSALGTRGAGPAGWSRTLAAESVDHPDERRFLRDTAGRVRAAAVARALAGSYLLPAQWRARYVRRGGALDARREEWNVLLFPDGRVRRVAHGVADDAPGPSPPPDAARALALAAVRAGVAGPGVDPGRLGEATLIQTPRPRRLDSAVEYVDSAVTLPGGATARVRVHLAGTEAVSGERLVRLPEAWARRDEARQSRRELVTAVASIALLGGLVALVVRGMRRRPALPPVVTGRPAARVGLAAGVVSLAASLNGLPVVLSEWDTAVPWRSFLATTAVTQPLAAAMAGLVVGALWAGVDALRRRAGLPFRPATAGDAAPAARDGVLLGAALGLAPAALGLLLPLARAGAWPEPPSTTLDAVAPWAVHVLRALRSFAWAPAAALPAAALAAGVRGTRARVAVVAALALALAAAVVIASVVVGAGGGATWRVAAAAAAVAGAVAAAALTVWAFGRGSAVAWLAAPPAAAVALGVAGARAAANGTDRLAAILGALAGAALLAALYRWAARPPGAARAA